MKRAWLLVVVLIVGLGMGCTVVETYDDEGQGIDIGVGKEFIIALGSNPTTGYSWQADYDESMLQLVQWNYEEEETEEGVVGTGGVDYFRFKALEVGETEITLTYAQHLEGGAVGGTKVFTVNIES